MAVEDAAALEDDGGFEEVFILRGNHVLYTNYWCKARSCPEYLQQILQGSSVWAGDAKLDCLGF